MNEEIETREPVLDRRLRQGPLRVNSLFSPERAAHVSLRALQRRRRRAAFGVLALAAACVLLWTSQAARVEPLLSARPDRSRPAAPLKLADGSTVALDGADATLITEEVSPKRVRVRLSGGARFDVTPDRARTFEVVTAQVTVRVLGTSFSLDPDGVRTRVAVERGRVQVIWSAGSRVLGAGEVGTFPPSPETTAAPATAQPMLPDETSVGIESPAVASRRAASTAKQPQARATELMLAADVARLGAQPEAAVAPLQELVRRFPRDRRAPVAAFTLGRVLDELGRRGEAAAAFERADALWPAGPLAESALARAVEAHVRTGNTHRAHTLAQQYLKRFDQGKHVQAMRSVLAQ